MLLLDLSTLTDGQTRVLVPEQPRQVCMCLPGSLSLMEIVAAHPLLCNDYRERMMIVKKTTQLK